MSASVLRVTFSKNEDAQIGKKCNKKNSDLVLPELFTFLSKMGYMLQNFLCTRYIFFSSETSHHKGS